MASLKVNKNILLAVALIVVAGVGYYMFSSSSSSSSAALVTTTGGSAGTQVVGQELVTELNRLQALKNVDPKFVNDPVFSSLEDFTKQVPAQPLGRINPFAPVGNDF